MTLQEVSYSSPIFLGGLDRTGKTILRLMLTSHPNIAITRRTYLWSKYYNKFGNLGVFENFNQCLKAILDSKSISFLDPDEEEIRREFSKGEATYARLFAIIQMQYASRMGKSRWGDQMGMIEQYADVIISSYPEAKIIHMIRDPRDRYEEKFENNKSKPGKVGWETGRWLKSIRLANRNILRFPENYRILGYEKLISDPEGTLRAICDFIEEPFEPGMIKMDEALRFGVEPLDVNIFQQGGESRTSVGSYGGERILSNRDISFIQASAHNEMRTTGYSLDDIRFSIGDWMKYIFVNWPVNATGMLVYKYSTPDTKVM